MLSRRGGICFDQYLARIKATVGLNELIIGAILRQSIHNRKDFGFAHRSAARVGGTLVKYSGIMWIEPEQFTHCFEHCISVANPYQRPTKLHQREAVIRYKGETLL